MDVTRFAYIGPTRGVSVLAHDLEAAGLSVSYQPPREKKGSGNHTLSVVSVMISATGPIPEAISVVRAFKARAGGGARIEGIPDEPVSIPERLAQLDKLKADGVITADEHSDPRARIIREV